MGPTRRAATSLVAALLFVACADDRGPTGPALDESAEDSPTPALAALACAADVRAGTLACAPPAPDAALPPGASGLIVGGQHTFVALASSNTCYETGCTGGDPGDDIFQADVTVKNLIPQALGTADGASGHAAGVRVFFTAEPACTDGDGTCGTVTVANEDGTADFTGSTQPFFQYGGDPLAGATGDELGADGRLADDETSAARTWQWNVPAEVSTFAFTVYVSAAVQYPDGWVEVSETAVALSSSGTHQLTAAVLDVVGRPVPGATVTWSSSDETVATVHPTTGQVKAAGAGTATITAASDGAQAPGATAVTAGVIFVDADAAGGAGDGTSWTDAFTSVEDALAATAPGEQLWIAEGTYTPCPFCLTLGDSIALFGGFAGGETARSQRDWTTNGTILSGGGQVTTLLTIPAGVDGVRIDGITLRDAARGAVETAGGLAVLNCLFSGNSDPTAGGAGILITGGHTAVIGSVFRQNGNATLKVVGGTVDIVSSLVAENIFITGSENHGSALRVDNGGGATVTNSTFSANVDAATTEINAAVHVGDSGSTLTLRNSILWGDTAQTGFGEVYVDANGTASIGNSVIEGGLAGIGGGGAVTDLGGNLGANPFGGTDYRLSHGSSAIDAGDAGALPADLYDVDGDGDVAEPLPLDLDGNPRDVGSTVDMGAYEHDGSAAPPANTTRYVSPEGSDANDGSSWGAAFASVAAALAASQPGDAVWVAAGTYINAVDTTVVGTDTTFTLEAIPLPSGVALYGGFAGDELQPYDLSQRDFVANETVLTALEETVSIFTADGTFGSTRVDGFTIIDSRAGAAKLSDGAAVTFAECRFLRNSASSNGGALQVNSGSHATLLNSTFAGNGATLGGAISLNGASADIINGIFLGNQGFNRGGAIFTSGGARVTITNSTFVENTALSSGYAIRMDAAADRATITNSVLWGDSITHTDTIPTVNGDSIVVSDTLLISAASAAELVIGNSILEGGLAAIKLGSPTDDGGNSAVYPAFILFPTAGVDGSWGTADDVGDLRLQATSPALDAGLNGALPPDAADLDHDGTVSEPVPVDRAGVPRVVDAGGGAIVDMGAYERQTGS